MTTLLHGTSVALSGKAVFLRGSPGSGKSDLALRLLEAPQSGLIADDQTEFKLQGGKVWANCPRSIRGQLEVRGLGIIRLKPHRACTLALVVDLLNWTEIERLPEEASLQTELLGHNFKRIWVDPFMASAVARIHAAMRHFGVTKT